MISYFTRILNRFNRTVFFSQMTPLLKLGAKRSLVADDMPELPTHLDPKSKVLDESKLVWTSGPALLRSLWFAALSRWRNALAFSLLFAAMNLCGPVLLNRFVALLSTDPGNSAVLLYGLGVGLAGMIGGLAIQHYLFHNLSLFQIITNVLNTKIFSHAIVLKKEAREATPVGDIVNHMSSDTESISEFTSSLMELVTSVFTVIGAVSLLFYYLGSTAWVAVVLMSVLAPLTKKVSREFTRFDEDLMKWRDRRITLMSQVLSAIRLVKHFGWEKSVTDEVTTMRNGELGSRARLAKAELLVTLIYVAVGTFVLFAVLAVHTWRGGTFDAALLFTCVSLFGLLEDPFGNISRVVSQIIQSKVAAERVTGFLKQPTVSELPSLGSHADGEPRAIGFEFESLKVAPGSSLAVVGGVGSGKSTLIHAMLGETDGYFRDLKLEKCRIGFVSQESYILNGTLRENLTFGRSDVSDEELQHALDVSCFAADVAVMPSGLQTEIGEKGINLSGGQRQRLSLARAVLHRPQIVILDDPLSAVDSATEAALIRNLLAGPHAEWRHVTRVMITHRLSHLDQFDQVAFLKNGELVAHGSFEELRVRSQEFQSYLDEYALSQTHAGSGFSDARDTSGEALAVRDGDEMRVTEDEDRGFGAVAGGMYWQYVRTLGGTNDRWRPLVLVMLALAAMSLTLLPLLQKAWLAFVANVQAHPGQPVGALGQHFVGLAADPMRAIYTYGVLGLVVLAGALWADLFWLQRGLKAGQIVHDGMLQSVLGARIRFFDSTPVGRTLQRFSRDMESIDIQLRWSFEHSLKALAQVLLTLALIISVLPLVLVFFVPIFAVYYWYQKVYRSSSREAKRLDSVSRSPRYAHFKETLQGLVVIRAYGKTEWFLEEFYRRLARSQRMFYASLMLNRWFSSRIPVVGGLVSIVTALAIVMAVRGGQLSSGMAGLITVYSLSFWGVLNWGIRVWSEVEARMTSLERVRFYSKLPQEVSSHAAPGEVVEISPSWPERGEITFEKVEARYSEGRPLILKGVDFKVDGGSRCGIVGRTGSGKSTIFQALYRFIDVERGRILIDGVDIAKIPLARLRRALAIIPQDPTLFMGSIRLNLDRYREHTDAALWSVLDRTSLGDFVRGLPRGLETELVENGVNLSQGQRQLLCLARALLMKARIILLDEATASVDVKTDATVQRVLRETCDGVTILMIAHRLGTTRDCDLVIEIKDGVVKRRLTPKLALGVHPV